MGLFRNLFFMTFATLSYGKECLKNDDIGWREGNIYECNDASYPECCEQEEKFTCCEASHYKTLREQLQLWGTVSFFVLVLLVLYVYYRRDFKSDNTSNSNCIPCCKNKDKRDDDMEEEDVHLHQKRTNPYFFSD